MDYPTILLTGGTGFLGSHLAKKLLQNNYKVIILKRSFSNLKRIEPIVSQLTLYDIDTIDLEQPFHDFPKIAAVIHTATCYGLQNENLSTILAANTLFPLNLLELAVKYKTPYFINTDTFYNKSNYSSQYRNGYSLSKQQFVPWGQILANQEKIGFINLRIEHLFGGGDSEKKFINFLIRTCLKNQETLPLTSGEQKRDFIHVKDAVSAYLTILNNPSQIHQSYQEYEVGTGQAVTLRKFIEKVHKISQSKTILEFGKIPYREGDIMYSQADIEHLQKLGWQLQEDLDTRLQETIEIERKFLTKSS